MSNPFTYDFQFGDGTVHDASVTETSTAQSICFQYGWSINPVSSGLNGSPQYSIEVSNDNLTWSSYDPLTQDAAIDQGFDDTHLNFLYIRIRYDAVDNTTGTVSFSLILKK